MFKKIHRLVFACILCVALLFGTANAASVVVVFAPETTYMDPEFYNIVRSEISKYTRRVVMGAEIDVEYAEFVEGVSRYFMVPEFADRYGCDYFVRICPGKPSSWTGNHFNVHTGQVTPLGCYTIDVTGTVTSPDRVTLHKAESAAYSSDGHQMSNLNYITEEELILKSFQRNIEYIFNTLGRYIYEEPDSNAEPFNPEPREIE